MKTVSQITDTVIMVPPDTFGFNQETATTNVFNSPIPHIKRIQEEASSEFEDMVSVLKKEKINVLVLSGREDVLTPDAVFPNNWFTTHSDGTLIIYPMKNPSRQVEKQSEKLQETLRKNKFEIRRLIDFSSYEKKRKALESTGSIVFEHTKKHAFAVESPRTDRILFHKWCRLFDYTPLLFHATYDKRPIYHTNVMMNIGEGYVVICTDAIIESEKTRVLHTLKELNLDIIEISKDQLTSFCANILHLRTTDRKKKLVMSDTAFHALTIDQKNILSRYGKLVVVKINTIEKIGGGSARCMMSEIFLPPRSRSDDS